MINKKKLAMLPLLTALIMTLMFANLNVASTGAGATGAGAGAGTGNPGNPAVNMTFNSNVTMEFETGNTAWIGSGKYLYVYNETKGENITELGPGTVLSAATKPGWGYYEPEPGDWFYIYGTLYGMDVAFQIDQVWMPGWTFNISETWEHWLRAPRNYTEDNDFHETPVDEFEAELMISTIKTDVGYTAFVDGKTYNVPPTVGSCWNITYHDCLIGNVFNISDVGTGAEEPDGWYYPVTFGELRNTTGDVVTEIPVPPAPDGFCPVEGLEGVQLITTMEPTEYRISSPACLLPEDSCWNITYPDELIETQFHVNTSERKPFVGVFYSYMNIDNINGSTTITPPGVKHIEAIWADAPNVATIGSCDWFKVIEGVTPYTPTCWNITSPGLAGVTFFIDRASDYVFHIDEVLNAAGVPENITLETAVENVTAEEFTPKIYIEVSPSPEGYKGWTFNVSIKTDYIFHAWSYEFTLAYDASVLTGIEVANGDLIAGGTATFMPGSFIAGELWLTGAKFDYTEPPAPQTYGPGTLATVTFKATDVGLSYLTLGDKTKLRGVTENGYGIKYDAIDYYITGQLIDAQLNVRLAGDADNDSDVDWDDFVLFAGFYPSKPALDWRGDLDGDGDVDWDDFVLFAGNYPKKL